MDKVYNVSEMLVITLLSYTAGYLMAGIGMVIDIIQEKLKAIRKRKKEKGKIENGDNC